MASQQMCIFIITVMSESEIALFLYVKCMMCFGCMYERDGTRICITRCVYRVNETAL